MVDRVPSGDVPDNSHAADKPAQAGKKQKDSQAAVIRVDDDFVAAFAASTRCVIAHRYPSLLQLLSYRVPAE
jgi:hypothetical protein